MASLAEDARCNPACHACHYRALEYPEQLRRKQVWADQTLGRSGNFVQRIVAAPEAERIGYRSKAWLRIARLDGRIVWGTFRSFRRGARWEEDFLDWSDCPLHDADLTCVLQRLGSAIDERTGGAPGAFDALALAGVWIAPPHAVLVGRGPLNPDLRAIDWAKLASGKLRTFWYHANSEVGRRVFGRGPLARLSEGDGPDESTPARVFRQSAQSLYERAQAQVLTALLSRSPEMILDLYCGGGGLGARLPATVDWLGIEMGKDAVMHANRATVPGRRLHRAWVGRVEDRLRDREVVGLVSDRYALHVNPPRSGMSIEATDALRALFRARAPLTIAYLSCSASSLARDLPEFEAEGYRVGSLQPYDFFPQTEHFETLAIMERL